ncbi:helix-turn-helix domain-containing protein [Cellvibrio mixtus]|uniref:helix-turn-helix domain-containing protein n=1 Tax=Cellvibrio mixtus TaxID=39650 RepID=UPI000586D201|nr:helix-turn-helix domain-containing protein [Cellvibrio mixtus]
MIGIQAMLSYLIEHGWSQSALARELGTTQSTIHRLVEKNQATSYELGKKIEKLYGDESQKKAA